MSNRQFISTNQKAIIIVGPTASGKSNLAVDVARYIKKNTKKLGIIGSAIISADSRQVYTGFNIGAGKITKKEMGGISHYGLDIASPLRRYTVAQYQTYTNTVLKKLWKQNIIPIICGGTGLYIDSVLYNYSFPQIKPNLKLRKKLEKLSTEKLFRLLQKKSPDRAQTIDKHNRRRLIRALEILDKQKEIPLLIKEPVFEALVIGINPPQKILYQKIYTRLIKRLQSGMIAEVKKLHTSGISYKRLESFGLEYRWIARFLQKKISKQEMITQLEKEIKNYTKRQITWFKRNKNIVWIKEPSITITIRYINEFLSKSKFKI
jgi:tRNA dimethylallyltransferase